MTHQKLFETIGEYFEDKPVNKVFVFGSYARGKVTPNSDIDLILSMSHPVGLLKLSGYKLELEEKLGIHVDLGTEGGISEFALPYINKEMKIIYERV